MTRRRGWAPKGERLVDKVPHGRWKTATFLAALRNDRIDAPCLFDGPINGERFRAYVEQFLAPTLKPGDVVILDNLGSHKGKAVRQAIRAVGARLRVSAQIFARPQSDRAGLRQVQDFAAKGRSPNIRRCRQRKRSHPRSIPGRTMRRLREERRIRVKPNAEGSKCYGVRFEVAGYRGSRRALRQRGKSRFSTAGQICLGLRSRASVSEGGS